MSIESTSFLGHLLANLRLTLLVIAVGAATVVVYALASDQSVEWTIIVYLALGMLLSSLVNAWLDTRRKRSANE